MNLKSAWMIPWSGPPVWICETNPGDDTKMFHVGPLGIESVPVQFDSTV